MTASPLPHPHPASYVITNFMSMRWNASKKSEFSATIFTRISFPCVSFQRSLAPLFSKASAPANLEATVPQQTERSPLTCIRSKASCDREVPETESIVRISLNYCMPRGIVLSLVPKFPTNFAKGRGKVIHKQL